MLLSLLLIRWFTDNNNKQILFYTLLHDILIIHQMFIFGFNSIPNAESVVYVSECM